MRAPCGTWGSGALAQLGCGWHDPTEGREGTATPVVLAESFSHTGG